MKNLKKYAQAGLLAIAASLTMMPTANAFLIDSAGKDQIDSAQTSIQEIGGATIVVCAMAWGIRKIRHI